MAASRKRQLVSSLAPAALRMLKSSARAQTPGDPPEIRLHLACLVFAHLLRASGQAILAISSVTLTYLVLSPLLFAHSPIQPRACCSMDLLASPTPVTSVAWPKMTACHSSAHISHSSRAPSTTSLMKPPERTPALSSGCDSAPAHLFITLQFCGLVDILSYCLIVQIY